MRSTVRAAAALACLASLTVLAWIAWGWERPAPLIRRSTRAECPGTDGHISQVYWYYEEGGKRIWHGPVLNFNNDGTLRMLTGFVHDEPADGTYRFYRTGELLMAKLTAHANAAYAFSYSLDGRETGQLYVWRGRGYEGTVLAINMESETRRGWISVYAGGRRVHEEECDLDDQFYPVLEAPVPEYFRCPESGSPTGAPPPSSPRATGEKAAIEACNAPDAR